MLFRTLLCLSLALPLLGQENPTDPVEDALPSKDNVQVAVLGYHDFSTKRKITQMLIRTNDFRQQMQRIKDANIPVISMEDFLAWKSGEKTLPQNCILITIDDGWLSNYTDAYPVLKEFGFPFTLFLYTAYLDSGGGRSLTSSQVKEMMQHGATVGSHSDTHPFGSTVRKNKEKGEQHFTQFLESEMVSSAKTLRKKFGTAVSTYAYPGGIHTKEMYSVGEKAGYKAMFTVIPGKVRIDSPNEQLNRYIVHGDNSIQFEKALNFIGARSLDSLNSAANVRLPIDVSPVPGSLVTERLPAITADLSKLKNIDPSSITLSIGGFGKVPHQYDPEKKQVMWKVNRRLRSETCEVVLRYRLLGAEKMETPIRWIFGIDIEAAYQPLQRQ